MRVCSRRTAGQLQQSSVRIGEAAAGVVVPRAPCGKDKEVAAFGKVRLGGGFTAGRWKSNGKVAPAQSILLQKQVSFRGNEIKGLN